MFILDQTIDQSVKSIDASTMGDACHFFLGFRERFLRHHPAITIMRPSGRHMGLKQELFHLFGEEFIGIKNLIP